MPGYAVNVPSATCRLARESIDVAALSTPRRRLHRPIFGPGWKRRKRKNRAILWVRQRWRPGCAAQALGLERLLRSHSRWGEDRPPTAARRIIQRACVFGTVGTAWARLLQVQQVED